MPKQWILGQVSGVAVDARDHVWIIQRPWSLNDDEKAENPEAECCTPAPPVMEFDAAGNYLQGWGGEGAGLRMAGGRARHPRRLQGQRLDLVGRRTAAARAHREPDSEVHAATGKFLLQVGHRGKSKGSLDTANFNNAADIYVYPKTNEVFVADGYVNRRVIVLDADTGAFKRMWGAYGNPPDDAAPNRLADEGPGPQQFNLVHGVRVSNDGLVYVADRHEQPHAGVHDRRQVPARDLRRAEDASCSARRSRSRSHPTPRSSICISPTPATAGSTSSIARRCEEVGSFGRIGHYAGAVRLPAQRRHRFEGRTSTRPKSAPAAACRSSSRPNRGKIYEFLISPWRTHESIDDRGDPVRRGADRHGRRPEDDDAEERRQPARSHRMDHRRRQHLRSSTDGRRSRGARPARTSIRSKARNGAPAPTSRRRSRPTRR